MRHYESDEPKLRKARASLSECKHYAPTRRKDYVSVDSEEGGVEPTINVSSFFRLQVMQWELCNVSNVMFNLENTKKMVSVGYRDLSIMDRHLQAPHGNLSIQVCTV